MDRKKSLVVLGNGPSLKDFNFQDVEDVDTLGMNAAYRYWDRIDWYPTIYCCLDDQLVLSHDKEILRLIEHDLCKIFFLHPNILKNHPKLSQYQNIYFLCSFLRGETHEKTVKTYSLPQYSSFYFRSSMPGKITTGSYAIRFAAHMGYDDFYLIGIDCNYVELIPEATAGEGISLEISATPTQNPNYFFDDYQQKGDVYNTPNPSVHNGNLHLMAFEALKADFESWAKSIAIQLLTKKSALYENSLFDFTDPKNLLCKRESEPLTLRESNLLFRNHDYLAAMRGYLELHRCDPEFSVYKNNILLTWNRLKMASVVIETTFNQSELQEIEHILVDPH